MTKERRKKLTITGQVQTKMLLIKKKIIYFLYLKLDVLPIHLLS